MREFIEGVRVVFKVRLKMLLLFFTYIVEHEKRRKLLRECFIREDWKYVEAVSHAVRTRGGQDLLDCF